MKILSFLIALPLLWIVPMGSVPSSENIQLPPDRIEVLFNTSRTVEDLLGLKEELKEQNITLVYNDMSFDDNGYLTEIDFMVDCNDGFKGAAKSSQLDADSRFGFFRDYSEDAEVAFQVGWLP